MSTASLAPLSSGEIVDLHASESLDRFDFLVIQRRDPNGWEHEPSDRDHDVFERWVTRTYGATALHAYYSAS